MQSSNPHNPWRQRQDEFYMEEPGLVISVYVEKGGGGEDREEETSPFLDFGIAFDKCSPKS